MLWSLIPYQYDYENQTQPLINSNHQQKLYKDNDQIPKLLVQKGFASFGKIKSFLNRYERNSSLETIIIEQINQTQNSSNYYGLQYNYNCFAFSYQDVHLIAIITNDFCFNLIYDEDNKYYIMSQYDDLRFDIQTNDFRYIYMTDYSSSKEIEEKTPKIIYDQLYDYYCELMM
jgi:hypothetical protein